MSEKTFFKSLGTSQPRSPRSQVLVVSEKRQIHCPGIEVGNFCKNCYKNEIYNKHNLVRFLRLCGQGIPWRYLFMMRPWNTLWCSLLSLLIRTLASHIFLVETGNYPKGPKKKKERIELKTYGDYFRAKHNYINSFERQDSYDFCEDRMKKVRKINFSTLRVMYQC